MKNIIAYSFILFFAGISLVSCLGDLDTMPLDDNQLVSEKVYQTKDGYTGVAVFCLVHLFTYQLVIIQRHRVQVAQARNQTYAREEQNKRISNYIFHIVV